MCPRSVNRRGFQTRDELFTRRFDSLLISSRGDTSLLSSTARTKVFVFPMEIRSRNADTESLRRCLAAYSTDRLNIAGSREYNISSNFFRVYAVLLVLTVIMIYLVINHTMRNNAEHKAHQQLFKASSQ